MAATGLLEHGGGGWLRGGLAAAASPIPPAVTAGGLFGVLFLVAGLGIAFLLLLCQFVELLADVLRGKIKILIKIDQNSLQISLKLQTYTRQRFLIDD